MRRLAVFVAVALCALAACSSNGSDKPASPSGPTATLPPTTTTGPVSTTTTAPVTTTTAACHAVGSTEPVITASAGTAALLRAVGVTGERCSDRVVFDFTTAAAGKPKCTI